MVIRQRQPRVFFQSFVFLLDERERKERRHETLKIRGCIDYREKKRCVVGGRFSNFAVLSRAGEGKGGSSTREMATRERRRREGPRRIVLSKDNASRRGETRVANARTRFLPHVFKLNRATPSWSR